MLGSAQSEIMSNRRSAEWKNGRSKATNSKSDLQCKLLTSAVGVGLPHIYKRGMRSGSRCNEETLVLKR